MPFLAILQADLVNMTRSWVVRIWLVLMAFQSFLTTAQALEEDIAAERRREHEERGSRRVKERQIHAVVDAPETVPSE